MSVRGLFAAALVVAAVPLAAGCGDDDNGDGDTGTASAPAATTETATTPAAGGTLTIRMKEFAFTPKDATAKAGKVKISAPNDGSVVHELVLLKTDADPAKLPKKDGEVDESKSVGEIADVEPGKTKSGTFELTPGSYAMICALPGHYEGGMYGSLTVK